MIAVWFQLKLFPDESIKKLGKRHLDLNGKSISTRKLKTELSKIQQNGQYYTTNQSEILEGFEHIPKGKIVVEPFTGGDDLTNWALDHGAVTVEKYDLNPVTEGTIKNDSIMNPPDFKGKTVITNPPFLRSNKNKNKEPYKKWNQDDLYKCHIQALVDGEVEDGVIILPSNFLCERWDKARDVFFSNFQPTLVKYYQMQIFPKVTTGICVIDFKRVDKANTRRFDIQFYPENKIETVTINKKYSWLWGDEFFEYIVKKPTYKFSKLEYGQKSNTNIVIGLLDKGTYSLGAHYNEGEPIYCNPKAFTTYQLKIEGLNLTKDQQYGIIKEYNERLNYFRKKYHSMFLSNYLGGDQKIKSRDYSNRLLETVIRKELEGDNSRANQTHC